MEVNSVSVPTCILNSSIESDDTSVEISYDPIAQTILYNVNVSQGTYVAVGYGNSLIDTDMTYWNGDGANSTHKDLYSNG